VLDGIGPEHPVGIEVGRLEGPGEKLAGRTDERLSLTVLLITGLLAEQHEIGVCSTFPDHCLDRVLVELAALTFLRCPA